MTLLAPYCRYTILLLAALCCMPPAMGQVRFDIASPAPLLSGLAQPAGISQLKHATYIASHHLAYGLPALSSFSAGVGLPISMQSGIGVTAQRAGIQGWRTHQLAFLYATSMGSASLGGKVRLHQINKAEEEAQFIPTIDMHSYLQLAKTLKAGAFVQNLLQQPASSPLPSSITLGLCQELSTEVRGYLNLHKILGHAPSVIAGITYQTEWFVGVISYQSHPHKMQVGLGIHQSQWSLFGDISRHEILGLSFGWVLQWKIPKKSEPPSATQNSGTAPPYEK